MNIAIIGAGNVGSALAASSARAGHSVKISSTRQDDAERLAREVGASAAASNRTAVEGAEIVILAVPLAAVEDILKEVGDGLRGKVIIDVTNRINPENLASVIDGTSNAEHIQTLIPDVPVIKAFNTVLAARQADPVVDGMRLDGFVAGDDVDAKAKVLDLVQSLGFYPLDVGPLAMARALEAMATLNISLNINNGWPWQDGWKLVGPTGDAA